MASIVTITPDNFQEQVVAEKKPVLLLCMPCDEQFPLQLKVLENLARQCGESVKVAWIKDVYLETFKNIFNIGGTPTFLMVRQGKEKRRMIGISELDTLSRFASFHQKDEDPDFGVTIVQSKKALTNHSYKDQDAGFEAEDKEYGAEFLSNSTQMRNFRKSKL